MVSMDAFASAFGFDAKSDDVWTTLGKVTAVNSDGSLSVLLGGSATPTRCEAYCVASSGDIVMVVISTGQARAIARKGGDGDGKFLPLTGGEMAGVIVNKFSNGAIAQDTTTGTNQFLETVAHDEGGTWFASFIQQLDANRRTRAGMVIRNMDNNGNWVRNGLDLYVAKDGTPTVSFDQPNAWMDALAGSATVKYTTTVSDVITASSNATISSVSFCRWGRLCMLMVYWSNKSAISVPANGNISNLTIGTLTNRAKPYHRIHPVSDGDNAGAAFYNMDSSGSLTVGAFDSRGAAYTIAAGSTHRLAITYLADSATW